MNRTQINRNIKSVSGQSQNPHAVSGQLQASLLQPFNIGSHYTHPVSFILNDYKKISVTFSLFANLFQKSNWVIHKLRIEKTFLQFRHLRNFRNSYPLKNPIELVPKLRTSFQN